MFRQWTGSGLPPSPNVMMHFGGDMPALQAADLIAYATYKCLVEQRIALIIWPEHFQRLFENKKHGEGRGLVFNNADRLEKYLRQLESQRRK